MNESQQDNEACEIAKKWCKSKGVGWTVNTQLGQGGTAPVFEVESTDGLRALKIYDEAFSSGQKGQIESERISQQLELRNHDCPSLVQIYDGGEFENRLFVLMSRAPGTELEKRLGDIPRNRIRTIVDQIAKATIFLKSKELCHRDIKSANIFISDDFSHATLLDISVIRDIHDPVGVGTDHDGQLPVLATARYSPPEYLFRLIDADSKLWHALNVYQLGGLLHDLIMREPLFDSEYSRSKENRYMFAWVVATIEPRIEADDVDHDLIFLARRALDKSWERRSSIAIEEFMADYSAQRSHSLQLIGLTGKQGNDERMVDNVGMLRRILEVTRGIEDAVASQLRIKGVTVVHTLSPLLDDTAKKLTFEWNTSSQIAHSDNTKITFDLDISLVEQFGKVFFNIVANLSRRENDHQKEASIKLPSVEDTEYVVTVLADQVISTLEDLAVKLSIQDKE